jgi:hypothetical protein
MEGVSPPEVFVGRHGWPLVRAGPMVPVGKFQQPSLGMDIGEIISLRSSMVRSETKRAIKEATSPVNLLASF